MTTRCPHLLLPALLILLLTGCASSAPSTPDSQNRAERQSRLPTHAVHHVEELLKFYPGVRVVRRGGGFKIRIRGSLREPLFVVDGMRLTPVPGQTLLGLNPDDVERIEVLTKPSDLAFYGLDAGGGVILITTKRR